MWCTCLWSRVCVHDRARFRCRFHVSGCDMQCMCPWPSSILSVTVSVSVAVSMSVGDRVRVRLSVSMTIFISLSVSMSGKHVRVSAIMSVSVSVFLLMSVSVTVSESMSVARFVTVSVTLSVSVVVPVMSSVHGLDHIFERVTVRVAVCTFSVAVSMHNHVSVRVNVCFRVHGQPISTKFSRNLRNHGRYSLSSQIFEFLSVRVRRVEKHPKNRKFPT